MFEASSHAGRPAGRSTTASTDPDEIRPAWTREPDEKDDPDDPDRPADTPEPDAGDDRGDDAKLDDDPPF